MITKIQIRDYRSCVDATFRLHPHLSVLIGPNSSGKTNILNAVLLLKKLVEEEKPYYNGDETAAGQSHLKVWFDIDGKSIFFDAVVDIFTDENNNDVIVSSKQYWVAHAFTGSRKRHHLPLWMFREPAWPRGQERIMRLSRAQRYVFARRSLIEIPDVLVKPLSAIANTLAEMRYYSASQFTNPANCPVSFEIEKEVSP